MVQTGAPRLVPLAGNLWALTGLAGILAIAPGVILDAAAFAQEVVDDQIHHFRIARLPSIGYRSSLVEAFAPVRRSRLDPPIRGAASPAVSHLGTLDLCEGVGQKRSDGGAASPLVSGVELFQEIDVAVETRQ